MGGFLNERIESPFSIPPAHDWHARAAAAAALARSLDRAHGVLRWRWRWRSVTSRVTRVTHARVYVIAAHRARHYRCSCNEIVIYNEMKLPVISMKLQVAIFVTIRKPEIRRRANIAISGQVI